MTRLKSHSLHVRGLEVHLRAFDYNPVFIFYYPELKV